MNGYLDSLTSVEVPYTVYSPIAFRPILHIQRVACELWSCVPTSLASDSQQAERNPALCYNGSWRERAGRRDYLRIRGRWLRSY